jgi:acyl dehydratase
MLSLKSEVGKQVGPYSDEVTAERIVNFCKAIGSTAFNEGPPTFLTVFRKGEFDLFNQLGFDLSQVLHAEQEYDYENPVIAGDRVEFKTALTQVLEKQNSRSFMQFLTFETEFQAQRESVVVRIGKSKTTIVIRGSH